MAEIAEVKVVLNKVEEPFPNPNGSSSLPVEHALSFTKALSAKDPVSLPSVDVNMVSDKFSDLGKEPKAEKFSQEEEEQPSTPPPHPLQFQTSTNEGADLLHSTSLLTSEPQPDPLSLKPGGPTTPTKAAPSAPSKVHGTAAVWEINASRATKLARERDIAAAFSGLPRVKPQWTHNYMKILILGDDGLGKTTFIRNLFAAYASDVDFPVADASGHGASTIFSDHPEQLRTELTVKDDQESVCWHYLVQDTPGYGDFDHQNDACAQRKAILDYIKSCSAQYFDMELNPTRRSTMHSIPDTRVDVVLYFLPPHRLRRSDIRFIKLLTQAAGVPVVPILAKADSMTPEELQAYRNEVDSALNRHGLWHFSHAALVAAGARHGPPFAVVAASTIDRSVGRFWPVRRYPWGCCESLLSAHSELPVVRRLLFESAYWELKTNTEKGYLKFRRDQCSEKFSPVPRPLRGLVRLALAVGALFIVVNAAPLVRDEAVRKETVRRVKSKVDKAVESVSEKVQEVGERAEETVKTAKSVAGAAVETGKRQALKGAALLETPQVREAREAVGRDTMAARAQQQRPWWKKVFGFRDI
jgi:septin family protein